MSRLLKRARIIAACLALSASVAGCESFDPGVITDLIPDSKKKLPGERQNVFPEGVPGVEQGVPKDLVKGNQPPPDAQAAVNGPASVAVRCADTPGWQVYVPVRLADGATVAATPALPGLKPLEGRRLKPVAFGAEPEAEPVVQRGDPVTLVSRAGGMEVRMAGRVLGAAAVGATVSVENLGSRRIIRGRLVGPGTVEVNL